MTSFRAGLNHCEPATTQAMGALTKVTFRFGVDFDVRYLDRVPKRGDRVLHAGKTWIVTSVDADLVGTIAGSNRPRDYVRMARAHAREMRERGHKQRESTAQHLAADAEIAAKAAEVRKRTRH